MFDELLPPLYIQLRIQSGLSKAKLGKRIGVNRQTVTSYESGATRPDGDYERRLIEASGCSLLEVAEMACELLGKIIERSVVIVQEQEREPEEPHTVLERADREARELKRFLPPAMHRTLADQIHVTRMMELTLERQTAGLDELVSDCRRAAGPHVPGRGIPEQGATGPHAKRACLDNRTDGTPAGRSQSKPQQPKTKGSVP